MALLSLLAAFAVLAAVAFASVRGWIRLHGPVYAAGVIVGSLLATNAFILYADDPPEAADAVRPAIDVWPLVTVLAGCALGCALVALFRRCCVEASSGGSRRRRMVPHVPGGRRRPADCGGWRTVAELALFIASICACLYCFPSGAHDRNRFRGEGYRV